MVYVPGSAWPHPLGPTWAPQTEIWRRLLNTSRGLQIYLQSLDGTIDHAVEHRGVLKSVFKGVFNVSNLNVSAAPFHMLPVLHPPT